MEITEIARLEILQIAKESLCINEPVETFTDDAFLAESLRRIAGILCPCSKGALLKELVGSLEFIVEDMDLLKTKSEDLISKLLVVGDLLELTDVSTTDLTAKSTWLFAAPPSFVVRPHEITIIGIAPDEVNPISSITRLNHAGFRRFLPLDDDNGIDPHVLVQLGLIQISESAWLRTPKIKTEKQLLAEVDAKLGNADIAGTLTGFEILNTNANPKFYKGRWAEATNENGKYVMRRSQVYGGAQWCYGEFANGKCEKFIDLPFETTGKKLRGCDVGWHIQMAIDKQIGKPQEYRIRNSGGGCYFDFFSPIPLWAERRLVATAERSEPFKCLFSYQIEKNDLDAHIKFFIEYLWLKPVEE